ncbi:MAG: hypothetical protein KC613_10965, partial [Myxococcales bacterium]|nr:hypothetical protein [Myxococcales bacterium]
MTTPREPLEALFDAPTLDAWRAQVDAALKGADFERTLVKPTLDGIAIQPLYTQAPAAPTGLPGLAPFTRGSAAAPRVDARVLHASPGLAAEHREILTDLARGADSIHLRVGTPNRDGLAIHRLHDFERELQGIDLARTPMELDAGPFGVAAAALYVAAVRRTENARPARGGGFGVDPLGTIAAEGCLTGTLADALARLGRLGGWTHARDFDWVWRAATVDTGVYHLAGATDAQELAYALATGVEYLRALGEHGGLDAAHANGQIAFTLSLGAEFFQQIAKLRAARRLWA